MTKPLISDESLVSLATNLYQAHSGSREVPEEERAYWVKLARVAAAFFRAPSLEPGMKSHLAASRGLPRTLVEVVSVKYPTRVTIKLPEGTLVEADESALIDWGVDFGWTHIEDGKECLLHIDTFHSDHGAHPLTGEPWRGRTNPDALKAYSLLRDPEAQVQGKSK
jgi:hypothetical protein